MSAEEMPIGEPRDALEERLEGDLQRLASQAEDKLRERNYELAVRATLRPALNLALLLLSLYVLLLLMARAFGHGLFDYPLWLGLVLGIGLPSLLLVQRVARALRQPIGRLTALRALDEQLGLGERLQTAAEFLSTERQQGDPIGDPIGEGFRYATLEEADSAVSQAKHHGLELQPLPRSGIPHRLTWAFALLLLLTFLLPISGGGLALRGGAAPDSATQVDAERKGEEKDESALAMHTGPREPKQEEAQDESMASEPKKGRGNREEPEDARRSKGAAGMGRPTESAGSSGASQSTGSPSNQAQTSKAGKKSKKKPKKHKPKIEKKRKPNKARKEEESGSTVGKGAAGGSHRSPSASTWSSKDQVSSDEEEELEEEEEIEDESEEQEARGGVQPQLRDRRPPVNRDLGIGFGNQKNPDANGRGGPSEQKKSRGVASLVLGVPIPDHIKGHPNPGKTKITQEKVQPGAEDSPSITAESRTPAKKPIGPIADPELRPWMRQLLRTYFLSLRSPAVKRHGMPSQATQTLDSKKD
jgi:hypothetical protein